MFFSVVEHLIEGGGLVGAVTTARDNKWVAIGEKQFKNAGFTIGFCFMFVPYVLPEQEREASTVGVRRSRHPAESRDGMIRSLDGFVNVSDAAATAIPLVDTWRIRSA